MTTAIDDSPGVKFLMGMMDYDIPGIRYKLAAMHDPGNAKGSTGGLNDTA